MWLGNDLKLPQTRLTIVSYIILGMIALLLVGFWKLQVIDSDRYTQLAERNRVRTIPLIAPRGRMLDREGRVLVDNYPDRKSTRLNSSHSQISYAVFCLKKKKGIGLGCALQRIVAGKALVIIVYTHVRLVFRDRASH